MIDDRLVIVEGDCLIDLAKDVLNAQHLSDEVLDEAGLKVVQVLELRQVGPPSQNRHLRDEVAIVDRAWQVASQLLEDGENVRFQPLLLALRPVGFVVRGEIVYQIFEVFVCGDRAKRAINGAGHIIFRLQAIQKLEEIVQRVRLLTRLPQSFELMGRR